MTQVLPGPVSAARDSECEWPSALAGAAYARYAGKHLAIVRKRIIAVADTYESALAAAHAQFPDEMPYIAFIPALEAA
jgi:hypothetical protein